MRAGGRDSHHEPAGTWLTITGRQQPMFPRKGWGSTNGESSSPLVRTRASGELLKREGVLRGNQIRSSTRLTIKEMTLQ